MKRAHWRNPDILSIPRAQSAIRSAPRQDITPASTARPLQPSVYLENTVLIGANLNLMTAQRVTTVHFMDQKGHNKLNARQLPNVLRKK